MLFDYCRKRAEVVCLQETHSSKADELVWTAEWGGAGIFSHGNNNSRGVCILTRKGANIGLYNSMSDPEGRYIITHLISPSQNIYTLCTVYAPNKDNSFFFDALSQNLCDYPAERVIIGDFNVVLNPKKDRYESTQNNWKSHGSLTELMDEHLLRDTWRCRNPDKQFFSWRRDFSRQASRIDMALISNGTDAKCENIMYVPAVGTDHSALFVSINDLKHERGKGYWKFNSNHLSRVDFCKDIEKKINIV